MPLLGVDVGYNLGYALIQNGRILDHGLLRTKGESHTRLGEIFNHTLFLIRRYSVDAIAVEKLFHGKSVPSLIRLSEARGAVLAAAGIAGIRVIEIHPAEAKKGITGTGAATKDQMIFMIKNITEIENLSHHEADAIALAIYAEQMEARQWNRAWNKT